MRLKERRAIVTGSARGIGKAIAAKFLQEGASIVLVDNRVEQLSACRAELAQIGPPVYEYAADVSDKSQVANLIEKVEDSWGGVDVLVNNAGIARMQDFLEITEESWDRTMAVNLKSVFLLSQVFAKKMIERKRSGAIVNTASVNGLIGEAGMAAYNASKAGVILLTKTMAIELGSHGIRVNCVCPGVIYTDLVKEAGFDDALIADYLTKIPLHRIGRPEDVANVVAFLASTEASFVTGTDVVIDGGQIIHL